MPMKIVHLYDGQLRIHVRFQEELIALISSSHGMACLRDSES
jgi:hypothetical protein